MLNMQIPGRSERDRHGCSEGGHVDGWWDARGC